MENTQDFLNKLNKLTFTKFTDKVLHSMEGFEVSYSIEMTSMNSIPLQMILRIRKDDVYVTSWGCSSNEDNELVCSWWQKKVSELYNREYTNRSEKEDYFKNQFNKL